MAIYGRLLDARWPGLCLGQRESLENAREHGIRFEQAREAFLPSAARYEDASPDEEARQACIGLRPITDCSMRVHVVREGDVLRLISLRLPDHVIDDLKEVAPSFGFGGYQALIRAYISNGLRKHLAELEAQRAKDTTVEEFSRRLIAHGVPEHAIEEAAAEMRADR